LKLILNFLDFYPIMQKVTNKTGQSFTLKRLSQKDSEALGNYFESLTETTRQKFGPHPLTKNYATFLCHRDIENAIRYVLVNDAGEIKGYFILDFNLIDHEAERYMQHGITLQAHKDVFFAPSIADDVQNSGIASQLMPYFIQTLRNDKVKSMVLLGGTRESNSLALHFYEKFGFKQVGGYQTDIFNIDMRLIL